MGLRPKQVPQLGGVCEWIFTGASLPTDDQLPGAGQPEDPSSSPTGSLIYLTLTI